MLAESKVMPGKLQVMRLAGMKTDFHVPYHSFFSTECSENRLQNTRLYNVILFHPFFTTILFYAGLIFISQYVFIMHL